MIPCTFLPASCHSEILFPDSKFGSSGGRTLQGLGLAERVATLQTALRRITVLLKLWLQEAVLLEHEPYIWLLMNKSDEQPLTDIKAHEILNLKQESKCVFILNVAKLALATGWLSLREISHPCREKPQCLLTTPSGQQCLQLHSFISAATTQTSS